MILESGDLDEMMKFVEIVPVPLTESLGTVTGKYPIFFDNALCPQ
jgi:hypothetical protein